MKNMKCFKETILILCILVLGMPSMAQSNKQTIKLGGGFANGKAYTTIKVNNKQILRLNSKKLTNGMLSFVNVRF